MCKYEIHNGILFNERVMMAITHVMTDDDFCHELKATYKSSFTIKNKMFDNLFNYQ
jgi:hypothetical protein